MKYKVIIEKYKKWAYIDNRGYYVWTNRYGDIIKIEDEFGNTKSIFNINIETIQDLQMHGIDAETELTNILAQHVAEGIDREIIQNLLNGNY